MKTDLFPLMVCSWFAFGLGAIVTAATYPTPSFVGSVICTCLAGWIAVAVTHEYRQP